MCYSRASEAPPDRDAVAVARLLLAHGADPNDAQGLYNTMFTPGNEWLEFCCPTASMHRTR